MPPGQAESVIGLLRAVSSYDEELRSGDEALRAGALPSPLDPVRRDPYEILILPTLFLLLEARRDRRDADFRMLGDLAERSIDRLKDVGAIDRDILRCRIALTYLHIAVFQPADRQQPSSKAHALFWESTRPLREQPDPDPILNLATAYGYVLQAKGVVEAMVELGSPRSQALATCRPKFERAQQALREAAETAPMDWLRKLALVHLEESTLAQRV